MDLALPDEFKNIYDHPVRVVNFDNGSEKMSAIVLPLALALSVINITPEIHNWAQLGYLRIIYHTKYKRNISEYLGIKIGDFLQLIRNTPGIFQLRVSFFTVKSSGLINTMRKVKSLEDVPQFINTYPPETIKSYDQKHKGTRVLTIAYTPEKDNHTQVVYSGINYTDNIQDLFGKVIDSYSRYKERAFIDW